MSKRILIRCSFALVGAICLAIANSINSTDLAPYVFLVCAAFAFVLALIPYED